MSALSSDERSRRPRPAASVGARHQPRWLLIAAATAPMIWLAGAGCNAPLNFPMHGNDGGDAGRDTTTPPDLTVIPDGGPEPDLHIDTPIAPPDVMPDVPRDLPVDPPPPDLPVDPPNDGPRDMPVDPRIEARPDTGGPDVVVNGPVVCTLDSQCRFPTLALHCLVAGGTGSCVECTGDGQGQCTNPAMPRCDTSNGVHRCVECLVSTDCPTFGTTQAEHPSTCTPLRHCLNGCDDSSGVACPDPSRSMCGGGGGGQTDHVCFGCTAQSQCARFCNSDLICVQCLVATDCASGQQCDGVSGNCVQCRDSTDCRLTGLRLCNPATHVCVSST